MLKAWNTTSNMPKDLWRACTARLQTAALLNMLRCCVPCDPYTCLPNAMCLSEEP